MQWFQTLLVYDPLNDAAFTCDLVTWVVNVCEQLNDFQFSDYFHLNLFLETGGKTMECLRKNKKESTVYRKTCNILLFFLLSFLVNHLATFHIHLCDPFGGSSSSGWESPL